MNLSERMKFKKEKAKMLLGKKRNCDTEEDNSLHASTESKNYIIEEEKLIPLSDKLDSLTKKEIKILRNRMSAQKSRDRKKRELEELKVLSQDLKKENKILKDKLSNAEIEIILLKRKIKSFSNLQNNEQVLSCSELIDVNQNNNRNNSNNVPINSNNLSTTVVDLSNSSRNNFNQRSKFGLLAGIILVCLIICCLQFSQFSRNSFESKDRLLISKKDNLPLPTNSLTPEDTKIIEYKTNYESNKPLFKIHEDKYLLYSKRKEMIINIANKMRVTQSIYNILPVHRNNFRDWDQNKSEPKQCLKTEEITSKVQDESFKNSLVTKDYFKNLEKKTIPHLEESTESFLCQDYISIGSNKLDQAIENVFL
jgi:hypothetical protein